MRSLAEFGQVEPIVINGRNVIIHGHARFEAARRLEWKEVSVIRIEHLTDEELRTFALSANKFTLEAQWDLGEVRIELEELGQVPEIDLSLTSFSTPEIDTLRGAYEANALNDLEDDVPDVAEGSDAVSRRGDFWHLGRHHLMCGDATSADDLAALLREGHADLLFTDPPYNVPIKGHVSGLGKARHREFAMGCGEMGRAEFVSFLTNSLKTSATHLVDGALAYVCMDHAHIGELIEAGGSVFTERKTICVWDKGSGGMGSLYRNAHELIAIFKHGTGQHINNIELGRHGRNRTTVWRYPGIARQGTGRAKALSLHPTVKPVAMVADAMLDATPAGGIVLDPFGGSGTTMIAAERTGRSARLLELDPLYLDTIIRRFEVFSGIAAVRADGASFTEAAAERATEVPEGSDL